MDKEIVKKTRNAIKNDDLTLLKELLSVYEELRDIKTAFGTLLHDAATYGKYDIVKYLIVSGCDVNVYGGVSNCGALTNAALKGYQNIVELLYDNGANLDVSNADRNPLFAAIYNGHYDVVKFLVEKGIDIKASYPIGQLDNVDAYEYARQYGQTEIANYLKAKLEEM